VNAGTAATTPNSVDTTFDVSRETDASRALDPLGD
jgi:hypothetical protein